MNRKEQREDKFNPIKLKKIMKERGYTQSFLSRCTNIGQVNISYYLAGTVTPSKKTVEKLAQELCVDVEDLLNDTTNPQQENEYQDILEIAKQLGDIRFKLIQMIEPLKQDETLYNSEDQDFLHKIENIEDLSEEDALQIIKDEQKKRKTRRNIKTKVRLIQILLNGYLLKNPLKYLETTIEKSKDWTYIPRVTEELKQDKELYDLEREQKFNERKAIVNEKQ